MNSDPVEKSPKSKKVNPSRIFQIAVIDTLQNKERELPGPNYTNYNDQDNLEEAGNQRNWHSSERSENYRKKNQENCRGKPFRGLHRTSDRPDRQRANSYYDRRNLFPKNKFHNTGSIVAENDRPICTYESSSINGLLESSNETVSPQCSDPTEKLTLNNSSELHRDAMGLQDGSSGYGSQEDVSISGSLGYKLSETNANHELNVWNCDLDELSTDGFIPPPTPPSPSNVTCGKSSSMAVIFGSSTSYHKEKGNIIPPPLPVPVSDIEDSKRESGEMTECSNTHSTSSSDVIQTTMLPGDGRICHFDPVTSNLNITVPVKDSCIDECEETSEEALSAHESLNGMDMVPDQVEAISKLLKNVEDDRTCNEYKTWKEVTAKLTTVVKKCIRGCWLEPFGSYVSGCAIGTSDMNFALIPNDHINSSHKLLQDMVRPIQKEIPDCEAVCDGQEYRTAFVSFHEPRSNIFCKIQILGNQNLCRTAKLLKRYRDLDERVKTLIVTVRNWAEVCEIHQEEDGRLHPLSYILMMIHFLQQCNPPVLPVIKTKYQDKKKEFESPQDNKQEVGYLWMEFLKYYSEIFNWKDNVVSITSKDPVLKASKTWGKCWIAIEEPYDEAVNVAKSVVSQDVSNYIRMVITKTYNYFLHPTSLYCDLPDDSNSDELSAETNEESQPSFDYEFYQDNFLNGLCVPVVCFECEHLGHLCDVCLHDESSMLHSLPKMSPEFLQVIDKVLIKMYDSYGLSEEQLKKREGLVERLQKHLRKRMKNAKVELIGSSKSGFGLKDSDVDLCFTLEGISAQTVNARIMVRKIKNILLTNLDFTDIMFICSSKIPIVKFIDRKTKLRCDISIYNELAVYNTHLLNAYSRIDKRVKILGCAMKNLAKKACINDTAQRTLSSYSYVLMVLFYLQQVEPPVIPVLQELYDSNGQKPKHIVENEDVWFYDNIEDLGNVWNGTGKNQQSVGELWTRLLEFYTTKFDFRHFISISQKGLLTELKTVSSSMLFNIQDPFIKNLNLGSRMSGDMSRRTLKALQRARVLFGTPIPTAKPPSGFESFQDYFFNAMNLTDGKVTGNIECSLCGKFGHREDKCRRHKLNPTRRWSKPQFQRNV